MYRVPVETMQEWKTNTPPEEIQKQSKELGEKMMAWMEKHKASFVGEMVALGKNTRMNKEGAQPLSNDLNGFHIIEANSVEEVIEMFKDNPHFDIPTSYLDIMEVPHMGM